MTDVLFVVDKLDHRNGLKDIYSHLSLDYSCALANEQEQITAAVAITNLPTAVASLTKKHATVFVLTPEYEYSVLYPTPEFKRTMLPAFKACKGVLTYSATFAKEFESKYGMKAYVQTPFVKSQDKSVPKYVLHSDPLDDEIKASINAEFQLFSEVSDFERASIYFDSDRHRKQTDLRICRAAAYGVPCVFFDTGVNFEFANGGDIVIAQTANNFQVVDSLKIALRDRNKNSQRSVSSALRFKNLSELMSRIHNTMRKKNINSANLPKMAFDLKAEKRDQRLKQIAAKKTEGAKRPTIMGKRETLQERERRLRRKIRREKEIRQASATPTYRVMETPSWFHNDEPVDVSIIVPMYRSRQVIEGQIASWDLADDGLTKEIIYVDDLCPLASYQTVVGSWEKRRTELRGRTVGKVIISDVNRGYGPNCNLGAKHAKGKYLVFLNADVNVGDNWVRPMFDMLEGDPTIGIVGNLQLHARNEQVIDSAGSQWVWSSGSFEHIGKSIYHNKRLDSALHLQHAPSDLLEPQEREMVTGCCFMIPKKIFEEIEGYNEAYKIGYWEDSDMNMAVKQKGYKVYYQPQSKVYHYVGHSKASGHAHMKQNRSRFYRRFVDSGYIDSIATYKLPKPDKRPFHDLKSSIKGEVVGCIIACNEEEFLEASVRSIAPMANRFVFVIGGNQYAYKAGMCDALGYPTDNTLEIAKRLAGEFNGIVIEPPGRIWQGKTEMRNAYVKHLNPGNWMFMLDGDEVYKEGQLWILSDLMQKYEVLRMQYYTFWNNVDTLGVGAWESYPQERLVKWRAGYHYHGKNHLTVSDGDKKEACNSVPTYNGGEKLFYHYSWVRPIEKIRQKVDYYFHQLRDEWRQPDAVHDDYVDRIFLKWREHPTKINSTHPRGGGGACPFAGIHPYEVTKLIQAGKLNF